MARSLKRGMIETSTTARERYGLTLFWARAEFDYNAVDDSSVQLSRGDIIAVFNTLESGWWDGLVGTERGWFPSNFVTVISEAEAKRGLVLCSVQQRPPDEIEIDPALPSPSDSEYWWPIEEPEQMADSYGNDIDNLQLTGEHSGQPMYVGRLSHGRSDLSVTVDDSAVPERTLSLRSLAAQRGRQPSLPPDHPPPSPDPTAIRWDERRRGVVFTSLTVPSRFWPVVDQMNDTVAATTPPIPVSPSLSFDNGGTSGPTDAMKTIPDGASAPRSVLQIMDEAPPANNFGETSQPLPDHRNNGSAEGNSSSSNEAIVKISRTMSSTEMFQHLVLRGCPDVTADLLTSSFSERPLAIGGLGDVYRCQLTNGMRVAVKCMRIYGPLDDEELYKTCLTNAVREVHTWSKLEHPHVLKLLGLADYNGQIGMVSPWIEHGSLRYYLKKTPQANRPRLCTHVADGLSYLHKSGVIHGDLKGDNVLISDSGEPLITDFGNAALLERTLQFTFTTTKGQLSPRWTASAPEILEGDPCSFESDVYALGMEAITGELPYAGVNDRAVMFAIVRGKIPKRPETQIQSAGKYGDMLWSLLESCWALDPVTRPVAATVGDKMRIIEPDDLMKTD
ncbi:hypothetical protein FRC09_000699 [Ceratobasidium sp. 395]|nr:hypothetical protein FRC09_000699 [Ceratobasidium sp. 395]